jgi:hypothetical protein
VLATLTRLAYVSLSISVKAHVLQKDSGHTRLVDFSLNMFAAPVPKGGRSCKSLQPTAKTISLDKAMAGTTVDETVGWTTNRMSDSASQILILQASAISCKKYQP